MAFSHPHSRSQEAEEIMELPNKEESWLPVGAPPADISIRLHGVTFHLNKKCMASRSSKLSEFLKSDQNIIDLSSTLCIDIQVDPKIFELAIKFCYGYEFHVTADTAVPLACLASALGMTDDYRPDNLLDKILDFIGTRVLPDWNMTIKAFSTVMPVRAKAEHLGLIGSCLRSICEKAVGDQSLLGDPTLIRSEKSARRRLFVEELTSLPLPLYDLVVSELAGSDINQEHLADCVYRYGRRWVDRRLMDPANKLEIRMPVADKINQKKVVEAIEKWMPEKRGAMSARCLFQLLRASIVLQASMECQKGFECRIGKQLQEASLEDLCMSPFGYTKETKYDVKRVLRIFYHFSSDILSELEAVADVIEDFSAEVAMDENLRKEEMMEILAALDGKILEPMKRGHDGVYRAIDTYLGMHGFLTEAERMDICRVLDVGRLSFEATEHAARNERLPPRLITQVVFLGQLSIRDAFGKLKVEEEDEVEEEEEEKEVLVRKLEMTRIHGRVSELEKECERMKEEIEKSEESERRKKKKKKRKGFWKEVKDVFGCKGNQFVDKYCHVKKKKKLCPNNGGGSLCG